LDNPRKGPENGKSVRTRKEIEKCQGRSGGDVKNWVAPMERAVLGVTSMPGRKQSGRDVWGKS